MNQPRLIAAWTRRAWAGDGWVLAAILMMSVVSALLIALVPWLWQHLIDAIDGEAAPTLGRLAAWMTVASVAQAAIYLALQSTRAWMNCRIEARSRALLFDHLTTLGPDGWRRWRTGDLVTRLYDDAGEKIAWFLCSGLLRAVEAVLVIIACLAAMLAIAPGVTAWVVLPLPLLIAAQSMTQSALGARFERVQRAISEINHELATSFEGVRILQACGLVPPAMTRFSRAVSRQEQAEIDTAKLQTGVFMLYGYGWQLTIVALLLAGGPRVMDGSLSLGAYITLEGLAMTLVWPMFDLGMLASRYTQAGVAINRLQELLDVPSTLPGSGATPAGASLTLVGASASATDGTVLLKPLDLHIAAGSLVGVVGEVGAGKSQLLGLLAGQIVPNTGRVLLGGAPLPEIDAANRASMLAFVPQDPALLSTSIRDNITLGRDVSDAALDEAVSLSRLRQDLPALPSGLDTVVGERGVTLSGGQQQRVALARALVGRPQLLVLDDATAALDADTEAALWRGLREALPDITTIIVTHRVATLEHANEVVVLDHGAVAERGTHAALLANDGAYQRLYGRLRARERVGLR